MWVGDRSLPHQFPGLYRCARDGRAKVSNYMERSSNVVAWTVIFRRDLFQSKGSSPLSLLEMLGNIFIPKDGTDCSYWVPSKDGSFSVASFADNPSFNNSYPRQLNFLWKLKVPPRVIIFG